MKPARFISLFRICLYCIVQPLIWLIIFHGWINPWADSSLSSGGCHQASDCIFSQFNQIGCDRFPEDLIVIKSSLIFKGFLGFPLPQVLKMLLLRVDHEDASGNTSVRRPRVQRNGEVTRGLTNL